MPIELVPIGACMLRRALREYMEHYHGERNHQGLDNQLIAPARVRHSQSKGIDRRSRLAGMLNAIHGVYPELLTNPPASTK